MNWQGLGVLVAMAAIVVSFLMSWRGQRQQQLIAEATAARAEAAARLTAGYTERVVVALETIAAEGLRPTARAAAAAAAHGGVHWAMEHAGGGNYTLTNVGTAPAYGLQLAGHSTLIGPRLVSGGPDLTTGQALTFMAEMTLATRDLTITVTWSDTPDGERRAWRYPLPARSPID